METSLLGQACCLYQTSPDQLTMLSGGHYNAVYRFPLNQPEHAVDSTIANRYGVLRIGVEDCPVEQTRGMLEWVRFLSGQGAPVAAPCPSKRGQLLERLEQDGKAYTITAFEEVEGILAERIPPEEWTDKLFHSIGSAAGKLHAVSKNYQASSPYPALPQWDESYEVREALESLTSKSDPVRHILTRLIGELRRLPQSPADYGVIHDDLHFANFLIQPSGKVTIIDFDDCGYGWFAMDVAMALFDVLVLYNAGSEPEKQTFARRFLTAYLGGYRAENELPPFWLQQIPNFLKLKEICVYVPLIGHAEIGQPGSWVGDFMSGRAERIANNIPYVDVDFGAL